MATLTIVTPVPASGSALAPAAVAAGGDQFLNDGDIVLYFKNTNASSRTVTIATGGTIGGIAIADVTVALAQNEEKLVGPFDPRIFNDSNGYVQLTYTADTGVTVAAIRVR